LRLPRLQPGDRLTAELLNQMLDAIERLENMTADASSGVELVRSAGGICLRSPSGAGQQQPAIVRVTVGTPTNGLWAAYVESCTNPDGNPPTWLDGTTCYAVDANAGLLIQGVIYNGLYVGLHADGTPVFSVSETAERNVAVLITSTDRTLAVSAGLWNGLYPGVVQNWEGGSVPGFTGAGISCWVQGPNADYLALAIYNVVLTGYVAGNATPLVYTANCATGIGRSDVVLIESGGATGGLYPAMVCRYNGSGTVTSTGQPCYAFGPNGGVLVPGAFHVATFIASNSQGSGLNPGLPIYAVAGTVIGGSCNTQANPPQIQLTAA
jgi:hypothetical protein